MNDTIAGASPVDQSVGRHVPSLIAAEMAQYSDGAYADHGSARDQLERFAAEVQAPLLARIRELTLYAAGVESERVADLERVRGDSMLADARRYRFIACLYDGAKSSRSELCLEALGIDGDPSDPLDLTIDKALAVESSNV